MEWLAGLHPKVIHFPIALLITFILFELAGSILKKEFYSKVAFQLLVLGVVGLLFAVLTGNQAFAANNLWSNSSKELFSKHETFANITVWYFATLLLFRVYLVIKKKFAGRIRLLILVFALMGGYLIFQTAEYGGDLVQKFGIGTKLNIDNAETSE